jgi:hypothetical protein
MMLPLNDDDRLLIKIGVILLTICAPALLSRETALAGCASAAMLISYAIYLQAKR